METGTDFHGSVIRVNDEDLSTDSASTDLLLFNLQGSDRESGRSLKENKATRKRGCSSAGRAPALQAGGHGFESHHLHHRSIQIERPLKEDTREGRWEESTRSNGL